MVDRTPQHRWAKWFPGAWTVAPTKAPVAHTRLLLAAAAILLLAVVVAGALAVGAFRRPSFVLQGVVPVPGSLGIPYVSASDDALWATVESGVLEIDPTTGTTTRFEVPDVLDGLVGLVARPDALWVADSGGDRVVRLDRATGKVTDEVHVPHAKGLKWQDGLWVQDQDSGDVVRISPTTRAIDLKLPDAMAFAVVPGALWYLTTTNGGISAVEVDPATGSERRRVAVPSEAAQSISIDAAGNPWIFSQQDERTTVVTVEAATGIVRKPFDLPHNVIGGIIPIGDTVWAFVGPSSPGGSRAVELGLTGPTGLVKPLPEGLDPDVPTVAFGSIWIPWDSKATLYRYPVDAFAP